MAKITASSIEQLPLADADRGQGSLSAGSRPLQGACLQSDPPAVTGSVTDLWQWGRQLVQRNGGQGLKEGPLSFLSSLSHRGR